MPKNRIIRGVSAIFFAILILTSGNIAEARTERWGYSPALERKMNDLDEDKVKTFAIPVLFGVELSDITPNFGDARGGGTRTHEGLDIMSPLGTPIVTPTDAVVLNVGTGPSSGNYVSTANPGGERFVYMHLDTLPDLKMGDVLKAGDIIGTVGDTGNAKGGPSHLHFEVRDDGKATDPYTRIKKEFTIKEKMTFLNKSFKNVDEEKETAKFIVQKYIKDFQAGVNTGVSLPNVITTELKKKGITNNAGLQKQLDEIIASIPKVLTKELKLDSQGPEVSLIQFYLISKKTGPAWSLLAKAGVTGFYGPTTAAAMTEYQTQAKIPLTGNYDAKTREAMTK